MLKLQPWFRTVVAAACISIVILTCGFSKNALADRPKIGLVLGGGGARGAAHVGVLKVLEREQIPIDFVAGTSMGAIVGALYASGYTAEGTEVILQSIDWKVALSDRGLRSQHSIRSKKNDVEFAIAAEAGFGSGKLQLPSGVLQGQQLELLIRRHLAHVAEVKNFDRFPIPFRAVATDLAAMKPVVFGAGDIVTAVRASMSVPGAFEPVRVDDKVLVDGGIVDNVPADVARAMGADVLIIVDVRTPLSPASELTSIGAVLNQVINGLMTNETDREIGNLGPRDILILPDLRDLRATDFQRSTEAIPWGEEAALARIGTLRELAVTDQDYQEFVSRHSVHPGGAPKIEHINVLHDSKGTRRAVDSLLAWQKGRALDIERLEVNIGELYSDQSYSSIQYEVMPSGENADLNIRLTEKSWGPTLIEAALRVSDNFDGDSNYLFSVESVSNDVNSSGAKWVNRARIGLRTGLFTEFYQPISVNRRNFIAASLEYAARNVNVRTEIDSSIWRDQRAAFAFEVGRSFSNHAEIRLGYEYGYADTRFRVGDPLLQADDSFTISQLTAEYLRDTLDDSAFPTQGLFVDVKFNQPFESLGADTDASAFFLDVYKPIRTGRGTILLGLSANGVDEGGPGFQEILTLGGITRLSGYQPDELFGTYAGLASVAYYRRLGGDSKSLFGTPFYVGGSIEAGNVWFFRDDITADSLIYAGSLFAGIDSPIGPIYFAYGRAEDGVDSIYLNIGSLFRRLPRR